MATEAEAVAQRLAELYELPFAGKPRGRFRVSEKHLRQLVGKKRLYAGEIDEIARALYELGYLLVDLDTFFVVLSQKAFTSYRRVNEGVLGE